MQTVYVDPYSDRFLADPYQDHEKLRDAGGVFWIEPRQVFGMARVKGGDKPGHRNAGVVLAGAE